MNKRGGLKSSLFLMEQLIVILVFALCAAICVKIFVSSYIIASDSKDLNHALLIAESGAECYKAAAGDMGKAAHILGGSLQSGVAGGLTVFYDDRWRVCADNEAAYVLRIINQAPEHTLASLLFSDLTVEKIAGPETLIAFSVATRREMR